MNNIAYIQPRRDKSGNVISYSIRVHRGRGVDGKQLKPHSMTWKPTPGMTARQIEKELKRQEVEFEKQCKAGFDVSNKQSFAAYADYVLELKERQGVKHRTLSRYKELLVRINEAIGHIKVADLKPQHLNEFYKMLGGAGVRKGGGKATPKADLAAILKGKSLSHAKLAELSEVSTSTISSVCNGKTVNANSAESLSKALGVSKTTLFTFAEDTRTLSNKTIVEHHRLIHSVLAQAEKEMLIMFNPAAKATTPKVEKKEANFFEVDEIEQIRDCLEKEALKWKVAVHLLLITGARRGEIMGIKWQSVDWHKNQICICNNLLYSKERGVYSDTPKTDESRRYVSLPAETMELLKLYRTWHENQAERCGDKWQYTDFLFVQESNGKPMHPDSLTDYCSKFAERYELPHINPHAFRHSQVAILYANGVDPLTISKRLGHSSVSFTADQYGHIMKQADESAAECVADVILRKSKDSGKIIKLPPAMEA